MMQDEHSHNHPHLNEEAVEIHKSSGAMPRYFIYFGNTIFNITALWQLHTRTLYRLVIVTPDGQLLPQSNPIIDEIVNNQRTRIVARRDIQQIESTLREDVTGIGIWGLQVWADQSIQNDPFLREALGCIHHIETLAAENAAVQYRQGPEIQRNIIANLPYILHSTVLDQWKNGYQNVPAVVTGAGPSLDRNLSALKQSQNRPLIFCVDTALNLLMQNGIEPDFAVSCDPTVLNTRHFKDLRLPQHTVFAYLPEIHRHILPALQHRNMLCLHDKNSNLLNQLLAKINLHTVFSRGMNVGFCAYSLAKALGCSPIILCGMDLALEAGKSSHAQGTANASLVEVDEENSTVQLTGNVHTDKSRVIAVDGYYGSTVTTLQHFYLVLQRFAQDIPTHSIPVINATEGGAHILGTTKIPLKDALLQHELVAKPKLMVQNPIISLDLIHDAAQQIQAFIHDLNRQHQSLERGISRINQWVKEVEINSYDMHTTQMQAETWLQRWQDILQHPAMDVCIDIGMAPARYDTYRIEPPKLDNPTALANWWRNWLQPHFQSMIADTQSYIHLYTSALQKLFALQKESI